PSPPAPVLLPGRARPTCRAPRVSRWDVRGSAGALAAGDLLPTDAPPRSRRGRGKSRGVSQGAAALDLLRRGGVGRAEARAERPHTRRARSRASREDQSDDPRGGPKPGRRRRRYAGGDTTHDPEAAAAVEAVDQAAPDLAAVKREALRPAGKTVVPRLRG